MKHNLMGQEKIENLGFGEVNSWETEEQVRNYRCSLISMHFRGREIYSGNWSKLTRWRRGTSTACVAKTKSTITCTKSECDTYNLTLMKTDMIKASKLNY